MADEPAGLALLRSLQAYGVEYVFGNFGTDHPPFLEGAATEPDAIPELVICPHETTALSAAHGYAAATNRPQAVIVHVDVGTQNMGAMVHDAHRGNAPVFIIAGLAPHTHDGQPASRDSWVHFLQDVYDQTGIVREFCRWTAEYRPPADPDEFVARGLELASSAPQGPVYLTATRESLDAEVPTDPGSRSPDGVSPTPADAETVEELTSLVASSSAPLVITSKLGSTDPERSVEALVDFAEAAGAGVIETGPASLCFPRTHEQHLGFDVQDALSQSDLVLLADVDIPWVPANTNVPDELPIVQIDANPAKGAYPRWEFPIDRRIAADAAATLGLIADELPSHRGEEPWADLQPSGANAWDARVTEERDEDRLTAATLTATLADFLDQETTIVNESTTNNTAVLQGLPIDRPGGYFFSHGSGLGWAPGAGVGVKLARPEERVVTLVGDGSYVFANPTSSAWVQGAAGAPTLTIIYNNSGWNAVKAATMRVHPEGRAATDGVPGSGFHPRMDLSHAANVVEAHTETIDELAQLEPAIEHGFDAIERGEPAVLDAHLEPIEPDR